MRSSGSHSEIRAPRPSRFPRITALSDLTRIAEAALAGDETSAKHLISLLYDELHKLAAARMARLPPGQTLQTTALVHEVYLRLAEDEGKDWKHRSYFFKAASIAMRNVLVEAARRRASLKRGGDRQHVPLDGREIVIEAPDDEVLAVHEALALLEGKDPEKAQIVLLRYFGGLTDAEIAEVLGLSVPTVERRWRYTRSWLKSVIAGDR